MKLISFFIFISYISFILTFEECSSLLWCNILPPKTSFYGFNTSINLNLWNKAKLFSFQGKQIFLNKIIQILNQPFNFIDGDKTFLNIEHIVDYFIDPKFMFSKITNGYISNNHKKKYASYILKNGKDDEKYIRQEYNNINYLKRAPIFQIGSFRYDKNGKIITVGVSAIRSPSRQEFLTEFSEIESHIQYPSIFICALNENWGWISTTFPNRTNAWGRFPKTLLQRNQMMKFLNSDKVLMLAVNQHINISHPKILVLPRGIPLQWVNTPRILWDAMNWIKNRESKTVLLASFASGWGPREYFSFSNFIYLFIYFFLLLFYLS